MTSFTNQSSRSLYHPGASVSTSNGLTTGLPSTKNMGTILTCVMFLSNQVGLEVSYSFHPLGFGGITP